MTDDTKLELVRLWLLKANSDLTAARRLLNDEDPTLDVAIYLCQQSAEKAVKAFLAFIDQPIERTHNIVLLVDLASKHDVNFKTLQTDVALLTPYATAFRYPSDSSHIMPSVEQVTEALDAAERVMVFVTVKLPLDKQSPTAPQS